MSTRVWAAGTDRRRQRVEPGARSTNTQSAWWGPRARSNTLAPPTARVADQRQEIGRLLDRDGVVRANIFTDAAVGTEIGVNDCFPFFNLDRFRGTHVDTFAGTLTFFQIDNSYHQKHSYGSFSGQQMEESADGLYRGRFEISGVNWFFSLVSHRQPETGKCPRHISFVTSQH